MASILDTLGRVHQKSNPYRPGIGESLHHTTWNHDLAGRIWQVVEPDGSFVQTSYQVNTATVIDQATRQRRTKTDALGRIKEVTEAPETESYLTLYTYDASDNLKTVTQGGQTRSFNYDGLNRLLEANNPENGSISYAYDPNGNLVTKTDARNRPTSYTYDNLNRVRSVTYSDFDPPTPNVTYTYDSAPLFGIGRLASVSSSASNPTFGSYDPLGRVTSNSQLTDGVPYSFSYTYDLSGALTSETYQVDLDNVPQRVSQCIQDFKGRYEISRRMNPFYLRADFDGDGRADYVVLITEPTTKKEGFAFCFSDEKKPQIIGAGTSVAVEGGVQGDNFAVFNVWGIAAGCGSEKHDCLYLEQAEAGSGWFIWNGRRFIWKQGAI